MKMKSKLKKKMVVPKLKICIYDCSQVLGLIHDLNLVNRIKK